MIISVIIPVYNVKPFLERCVRSVLNQTYKDLEIILVDDGSTDGSGDFCDQIAAGEPRIRVIHQQNQGLSGARNTGIRYATGEYIIFLDSDDEWILVDGLEKLIQENQPASDLIVFKNTDIWANNHKTSTPDYDVAYIEQLPNAQVIFSHLVKTQQLRVSAPFLIVRRNLLIENDIFFPLGFIGEDIFWSFHLWQHVDTVKINNMRFYGYYHRKDSITTSVSLRSYVSYDQIFTYWKEQCQHACVNAPAIRIHLANLWVSLGYDYYKICKTDQPSALNILKKHKDLLQYAATPKSIRVNFLVRYFGVRLTTFILGCYWRLRTIVKGNVC